MDDALLLTDGEGHRWTKNAKLLASMAQLPVPCAWMRTADFDYLLPEGLIAQHPPGRRDDSRLLVLGRAGETISHRRFRELPQILRSGDLLVFNDSKVIPARLRGQNPETGGRFELLLVEEVGANDWWAMLRPGRRARVGNAINILDSAGAPSSIYARVVEVNEEGHRRLQFHGIADLRPELPQLGETPLPPYIRRAARSELQEDLERYQTVYALPPGSLAAPTAGLHFTPELLAALETCGVATAFVTLHVGLGTFAPVKADNLADHRMHEERFEVSVEAAGKVNAARAESRRVIAVGTTTLRVLESVAAGGTGLLRAGPGRTRIFLHPPAQFQIVDALITNFHLPRSTLLMLVSAFASPGALRGRELILLAYAEAVRERYRFFSYGDAMFIE
jgi:S-adenosylmethionine:tRNA ribosyltransferase-isomerase